MGDDAGSFAKQLRDNTYKNFCRRLESEYKRIIDRLNEFYEEQTPGRKKELEKLDDEWRSYLKNNARGETPEKFYSFARSVAPDAFPDELITPPSFVDCDRLAYIVQPLLGKLKERGTGKNNRCWEVCDFCGKDADLDPEGCTGIRRIVMADDSCVTVEIGGHKTVGDPTHESEFDLSEDDEEEFGRSAQEIVSGSGYGGEWTGDDWNLDTKEIIDVPWRKDQTGKIDFDAMADAVISDSEKALDGFRKEMAYIDRLMKEIHEEIRRKYEPSNDLDGKDNGFSL